MNTAVISPVNTEERKNLGIKPGDTVRVWQKIEEKGKIRLQAFEGLVLACKHGTEAGATFTVRKVSLGVGVEKIFPLYSPVIDKIEIVKRARVRRAKLYYIRDKVAREARRQLRRMNLVSMGTESEMEQAAEAEKRASEEVERKAAEEAAKAAEAQAEAELKQEEAPVAEEKTEETKEKDSEAPRQAQGETGEEKKSE